MANDRLGQSSRAKMIALIVAEQRPRALHKILWSEISEGLNCENALLSFCVNRLMPCSTTQLFYFCVKIHVNLCNQIKNSG